MLTKEEFLELANNELIALEKKNSGRRDLTENYYQNAKGLVESGHFYEAYDLLQSENFRYETLASDKQQELRLMKLICIYLAVGVITDLNFVKELVEAGYNGALQLLMYMYCSDEENEDGLHGEDILWYIRGTEAGCEVPEGFDFYYELGDFFDWNSPSTTNLSEGILRWLVAQVDEFKKDEDEYDKDQIDRYVQLLGEFRASAKHNDAPTKITLDHEWVEQVIGQVIKEIKSRYGIEDEDWENEDWENEDWENEDWENEDDEECFDDIESSYEHFNRAAGHGYELAFNKFDSYYHDKASLKVAEEEYGKAMQEIGNENYIDAVEWLKKAVEKGYAPAQAMLAKCYYYGHGVDIDYRKGVALSFNAANQGNPIGQTDLAICYAKGKGMSQNPREAVKWFTKAAEQGNAEAQANLAACYLHATGVEKDEAKAVELYRQSATQENQEGQIGLGWCLINGFGVEYNIDNIVEGVQMIRLAANQGNAKALPLLQSFTAQLKMLASNGDEQAIQVLKQLSE